MDSENTSTGVSPAAGVVLRPTESDAVTITGAALGRAAAAAAAAAAEGERSSDQERDAARKPLR